MAGPSDQDKLSEDWGLDTIDAATSSFDIPGEDGGEEDWAAMLKASQDAAADGGVDRVLNQDEIDNLLGFADQQCARQLRASADARNRLRPPRASGDDLAA
jgi:hypothetical protein